MAATRAGASGFVVPALRLRTAVPAGAGALPASGDSPLAVCCGLRSGIFRDAKAIYPSRFSISIGCMRTQEKMG